jgi:hypothetical protein
MAQHEATQRYTHYTVADLREACDARCDPQARTQILERIKVAGYHQDHQAFLRLYREHRLSYAAAQAARTAGLRARQQGVTCACSACKNRPTS